MAIVYSGKTLCCHLATGSIFRSLDAGEKEASNSQRIPSVDFKGAMNERLLRAPLFADCCVKGVPEVYGRFQILKKIKTQRLPNGSCKMGVAFSTRVLRQIF